MKFRKHSKHSKKHTIYFVFKKQNKYDNEIEDKKKEIRKLKYIVSNIVIFLKNG